MPSRRRFLATVGGGLTGSWLARALPLGVGAGVLGWPRAAHGALATKSVVLDTANPLANFAVEGGQAFTPNIGVLPLLDQSVSDILNFYANDPAAAPGNAVDVFVAFQISSSTPNNIDSGVRFVINDGESKAVIAGCVTIGGVTGIGLAGGNNFSDPVNWPVFVPVNFAAPTTVRLRRTAAGDAEIVEVNGVAPVPRALILRASLPTRNRIVPTVDFGCAGPEALVNVDITQFYSETPATQIMGALVFTDFRIRDTDSTDRLRFRADFTLGALSDGIDPSTELVAVKLSTPTYGQFYPARAADFNPLSGFDVRGRTPRRRWSLNDSERTRTGIERLDFDENPNRTGAIVLRDLGTSLPALDYSTVTVMVDSGFDLFTETIQLVERRAGSGQWRLPR